MSATIPESMRLDDLLKATGYDCPAELQGKTFDQATEGGGGADLEDNKTVSITENGVVEITPSEGKDGMKKVTATVNVSGGGASFFDTINLNTDNPTYSKTLTKGATVYLNNKYVNMVARGGDVTETITSIGIVFATVTFVNLTQVLTITLNTSHPEASTGLEVKVWGE